VERLWGTPLIEEPTTKFDSCGFFSNAGDSQTVVIPSKTPGYQNALEFLNTLKVPLMGDYTIEIVDDDPQGFGCFNSAQGLFFGLSGGLALAALF
jgi:hypothetical protein